MLCKAYTMIVLYVAMTRNFNIAVCTFMYCSFEVVSFDLHFYSYKALCEIKS